MSARTAVSVREPSDLPADPAPPADRGESVYPMRTPGHAVPDVPHVPGVSRGVEAGVSGPVARCEGCDREYRTSASSDAGLCCRCDERERREYAVAYAHDWPERLNWEWSKTAMRERLGVTGDTDD